MFARFLLVSFLATVLLWSVLARASDGAGPTRHYVVRPGDSLWSIASEHYDGDPRAAVWKLQDRNGLAGGAISPGQRLVLPAG